MENCFLQDESPSLNRELLTYFTYLRSGVNFIKLGSVIHAIRIQRIDSCVEAV